jgi:hypothetical protein
VVGTGLPSWGWMFSDPWTSSPVDVIPAVANSSEVMGLAVLLTRAT